MFPGRRGKRWLTKQFTLANRRLRKLGQAMAGGTEGPMRDFGQSLERK
jgi:hypothetical protein